MQVVAGKRKSIPWSGRKKEGPLSPFVSLAVWGTHWDASGRRASMFGVQGCLSIFSAAGLQRASRDCSATCVADGCVTMGAIRHCPPRRRRVLRQIGLGTQDTWQPTVHDLRAPHGPFVRGVFSGLAVTWRWCMACGRSGRSPGRVSAWAALLLAPCGGGARERRRAARPMLLGGAASPCGIGHVARATRFARRRARLMSPRAVWRRLCPRQAGAARQRRCRNRRPARLPASSAGANAIEAALTRSAVRRHLPRLAWAGTPCRLQGVRGR